MAISFADIQDYLNAIADQNGAIDNSPHGRFWNVSYNDFINGTIPPPTMHCGGAAIPIIDKGSPVNSAFFVILTTSAGWCSKRQMPGGGPFVTDTGYSVTLANGTTLTGQQIQDNIQTWLSSGFPQ